MSKYREKIVSRIELETFCHATEVEDRVIQAILNIIPPNLHEDILKSMSIQALLGHYRNPIKVIRVKVLEKEKAQEIAKFILKRMPPLQFDILKNSLDQRIGKSSTLFFRLNKQDAYLNKISLSDSSDDVIKIKLGFLPHVRSRERLREMIEKLVRN